ncbi:MAG: metalloprotease [Bacteroidales bacterium]|jgi:predicted metalloprotease|nr:metalloprotease [Bacteroidales bacterium]
MKWINRNDSEKNYEDRRGRGIKRGAIGGIGGLIVVVIALLLGQNPLELLNLANSVAPGEQTEVYDPARATENEDLKVLSLGVFNSANDVWETIFNEQLNREYRRPVFVTFTDQTISECGGATASTGPFYCQLDEKVYIDLSFFHQLSQRFNAPGDLAMAYVTAHEVGHHVQKLLGTLDQMNEYRGSVSEVEYNRLNVKLELQADFFAGLWAHQAQKMGMILLEPGDLESAIRAAEAIGDDTLQKESQGYTMPDTFTHGTSVQRTYWFNKGFQTGDIRQGNTFNDSSLN